MTSGIHTHFFALCIVRLGHRFLLVEERDRRGWYLPGGRVEPGETLVEAACRETLEEAGIPIVVESILRIEHTPRADASARVRVVFIARPQDDTPPKTIADEHTRSARWFALEELRDLPLRGPDVDAYLYQVAQGAPLAPLSVLGAEA